MSDFRGRMSEDRGQRAEDRGQKAEDRCRWSDVGAWGLSLRSVGATPHMSLEGYDPTSRLKASTPHVGAPSRADHRRFYDISF